jgi:polyisoprenoid-binding protein YceI
VLLRMLTLLIIAGSSLAFGQSTWTIDSAHSAAQFSVRHMMISNVRGEFGKLTGTAVYDPANPEAAMVEATIDATTINTREPRRDDDLRSANFFETANYPIITFKSKKIEPLGEGHLKMTGDLTMHGVTREVVLDVTGLNNQVKDPRGNVHMGASATTRLNRKDFGINWNRTLDNGGVVVADEVDVILDVEMVKKVPTI